MFSEPRSHCHNWQNRLSSCSSFPTNNRKNTPRCCNQSPPSDPEGSSCGRRSVRWATNGGSEAKVWTAEVSKDLCFKTCSHQGDAAVNDSEGFLGLQCESHTLKKPKTPKKDGSCVSLCHPKNLYQNTSFRIFHLGSPFFGLKKTPGLCRFIAHQATITTLHRNTSLSLFSSTATPLTASRGGILPQLWTKYSNSNIPLDLYGERIAKSEEIRFSNVDSIAVYSRLISHKRESIHIDLPQTWKSNLPKVTVANIQREIPTQKSNPLNLNLKRKNAFCCPVENQMTCKYATIKT